jgi:D-cysteine desulfhydrase family pyridoxal phosphate-dependent enzyme
MFTREPFAHLPTRIESLPRLSAYLAGPEILIKRDDQTGVGLGGNKIRKLEYLIGQAISDGAEKVLTTGAAQSNHCRQTAAAATRSGLKCTLVLVGPEPEKATANLLLDTLLGADIIWTEQSKRDHDLQDAFQTAQDKGQRPFLIPYGGSNAVGAFAYYKAVEELKDQVGSDAPDWIVFATSSGGTQAGLVTGTKSFLPQCRVLGISVDEEESALRERVYTLCNQLTKELEDFPQITPEMILVNDRYIGDGYGVMNEKDKEAIHLFARLEGILLDPVYTGRAGAGLIDLIQSGFFPKEDKVLFWHTGGTPALFAERYQDVV